MQIRLKRVFDWFLNLAAVACVCYLAWNYGSHVFAVSHQPTAPHVGAKLPASAMKVDTASDKTLVMVLSTTCTYCRQSEPFYKQLLRNTPYGTHITAFFPQSIETVRTYLSESGLDSLTDVRQVDFAALGLSGTPTLLLLDREGVVRAMWAGLLPEAKQAEVLNAIGSKVGAGVENSQVDDPAQKTAALQLARELRTEPGLTILDGRDRSDFAQQHLAGAYNIPIDELEFRAPHEISRSKPVRIYCEFHASCNKLTQNGIPTPCDVEKQMLAAEGYKDVDIIYADLAELSSIGIPVAKQD